MMDKGNFNNICQTFDKFVAATRQRTTYDNTRAYPPTTTNY